MRCEDACVHGRLAHGTLAVLEAPSSVLYPRPPSEPLPLRAAGAQVGGPLMIKLGQWLSTRRELLSVQACNALARLHTNVRLLAGNLLVNTKIQRAAQL